MAGIKLIEINQFRGIRKLAVSDFSRINLRGDSTAVH